MDFTTKKLLERHCEDTIAYYFTNDGVKTYQADTDDKGRYVKTPNGSIVRLVDTVIQIENSNGIIYELSVDAVDAYCKAMFYLIHKMQEDGTMVDLGPVPTGHKKDCDMHSLCAHDIDEEHDWYDGW